MKSIVAYPDRGNGGNNKYQGNCSPLLIKDLAEQFEFRQLSDYMCGSGTTEDACKQLGIESHCYDLNRGYDMMAMDIPDHPENIFWHPPYDSIVVYSDVMYKAEDIINKYGFDPRTNDLSRCKNWDDFVKKMNYCCLKQFSSLEKGGRMSILMGDIKKNRKLYSMLLSICKPGTVEQIVIKQQFNCVSDGRSYNGKFIPIVHEYLLILRKDNALIYDVMFNKTTKQDVKEMQNITWRSLVASILEEKGKMSMDNLYNIVKETKKAQNNQYVREKIRQTLNANPEFRKTESSGWCAA